MKTTLKVPLDFLPFSDEPVISNLTGEVNVVIAEAIKNKKLFAYYTAWNFHGIIWWDDRIGYWIAEISVLRKYAGSYLAETLNELAREITTLHGKGETFGMMPD